MSDHSVSQSKSPRTQSQDRCREQRTLACLGFSAALGRLNQRKRLRAKLLAAMAGNVTRLHGTTFRSEAPGPLAAADDPDDGE